MAGCTGRAHSAGLKCPSSRFLLCLDCRDSGYPVPPVPPQLLYLAYNANIAKEPYFNLSWAAYNSGVPGLITLAMVR